MRNAPRTRAWGRFLPNPHGEETVTVISVVGWGVALRGSWYGTSE